MMHFLNVTDVLTNRVNCSGSTFNLTLFWRVVRDLRALLSQIGAEYQYRPEPGWICLSPPAASCRSWWSPGSSWAWRSWCGVTSAGNACCSLPPTGAPARCGSLCSDDAHQAPGYPAKTENSNSNSFIQSKIVGICFYNFTSNLLIWRLPLRLSNRYYGSHPRNTKRRVTPLF